MNGTTDGGFPGSGPAAPRRRARARRGVLLLVVLSMLTLFMMLGVAYLAVATRSRETAKAYARLSLRSDNVRLPHSQIFDTVMLRVLRGVPKGQSFNVSLAQPAQQFIGGTVKPAFESILADKYGLDTLAGTARPSGTDAAVVEKPPVVILPSVALDNNATPDAFDLVGRVLTLLGPGRDPSSHRILRAEKNGASYFIAVDNQPRNRQFEAIPEGASCRVVINGREFAGDGTAASPHEPWDGFDATNPLLARVLPRDIQNKPDSDPTSVASSVVKKVSLVGNGSDPAVLGLLASGTNGFDYGADNDNDGVKDGFFLDFGLPTVIAPNGDQIVLHASVLVVDLDGRVNVNAHGSLVPIVYPQTVRSGTHAHWTPGNLPPGFPGTPAGALAVPTGSGYGPAEVNIDLLFPQVDPATATYDVQRLRGTSPQNYPLENPAAYLRVGMTGSRMDSADHSGRAPWGSRFYSIDSNGDLTKTPVITDVEGRYGNVPPNRTYSTDEGAVPILSLAQPSVRFFWPPGQTLENFGYATINDPASAVNDHRSQIDPSTINDPVPRTLSHEGIPPAWWNADDGATFNWADNTNLVQATAGQNWKLPPPRAIYNSPPDLHGRMKTYTVPPAAGAMVPQVCYVKPEWSRNGRLDVETRDDPYELRLDARGPRNSWLKTPGMLFPNGNLFNLSELENILRPYDIDSTKLPPRLEAMLGSVAEEARLRITTDSWDTTAITGTAAAAISNWVKTKLPPAVRDSAASLFGEPLVATQAQLGGLLNREIARMERFDLARPLSGDKPPSYDITHRYYAQRQAYFKDLYVLLCALCEGGKGGFDADRCAQWAANVVEFCDADSTMTPFEYDSEPEDGWDVDGNAKTVDGPQRKLVFGTERPEIVIAQTSAWEDGTTGELFVMLHRPWKATAHGRIGTSTDRLVAAEACDPQFDRYDNKKNPVDQVDLGRKSGAAPSPPGTNTNVTDTATYPIWRLRIVDDSGATRYVRCDVSTAGAGEFVPASVTNTTTPRIGADEWLCLRGTNALAGQQVTYNNAAGNVDDRLIANFRVPGTCPPPGEPDRTAVVYLERLTDPTSSPTEADWNADPSAALKDIPEVQLDRMAVYRVVDQAKIVIVNRSPLPDGSVPPGKNAKKMERRTDDPQKTFWNNGAPEVGVDPGTDGNFAPVPSTQLGPYDATHAPTWFPWPNRPVVGSPELFFVHSLDSEKLLQDYTRPSLDPNVTPDHWTAGFLKKIQNPPLLDAVHVPTRFAGIHSSSSDPGDYLAKHAGIDQVTTPVNQLSSFREPGRVNLNTVGADDVWNAVVAGPLAKEDAGNPNPDDPDPLKTRRDADFATKPVQSTAGLLALAGDKPPAGVQTPIQDTNFALRDAIDRNALQGVYTATRLSNTVTTRSHLFGVWITLREGVAPATSPEPSDPDAVRYHRAFYIIDRSIPVAHEPGRDHNVWDAVLLRRIIE